MAKQAKTMQKSAAAIVPMHDNKAADVAPLTNTAKDEIVYCPFTRRDEYRSIQSEVRKANLWLATIAAQSVAIKATKTYVNEMSEYNEKLDDIITKTWTITRYAEAENDDTEAIRLDINLLKRACATGERLKYRFVNVNLKTGNVDFTK